MVGEIMCSYYIRITVKSPCLLETQRDYFVQMFLAGYTKRYILLLVIHRIY